MTQILQQPAAQMTLGQMIAAQDALNNEFLVHSTNYTNRFGARAHVDGGNISWTLPQFGLLSKLMLTVYGTITVAGTVTSGTFQNRPNPAPFVLGKQLRFYNNQSVFVRNHSLWGGYKWLRSRYGVDPFGGLTSGSLSTFNNAMVGNSALASAPGGTPSNPLPASNIAAGTYNIAMSFAIPIAYNNRLSTGALNLQSNSILYTLSLDTAQIASGISATGGTNDLFNALVGTGLSVTSNLTWTLNGEIFTIPAGHEPNESMVMTVQELTKSPLIAGENYLDLPNADIYTMMIAELYNAGAPVDPRTITETQFRYSGGTRRYDADPICQNAQFLYEHGIPQIDGVTAYDLGIRNGIVEQRDLFDGFNSASVTNAQIAITLPGTFAASGNNGITVLSETLKSATQG